ncbi:hypothetical protein BaRGS_00015685 [Batillaria attramentaria]|uniref:Uncharacterized protein n=1 Tax=Batillaria attramentaria TaxID=370345 RepID=A0ABD0JZI7_9CAEN
MVTPVTTLRIPKPTIDDWILERGPLDSKWLRVKKYTFTRLPANGKHRRLRSASTYYATDMPRSMVMQFNASFREIRSKIYRFAGAQRHFQKKVKPEDKELNSTDGTVKTLYSKGFLQTFTYDSDTGAQI